MDSISSKAKDGLHSHFDAIYEDLTTHIGTDHAVRVGIRYGIEIGAAAILDTLIECGLLNLSE